MAYNSDGDMLVPNSFPLVVTAFLSFWSVMIADYPSRNSAVYRRYSSIETESYYSLYVRNTSVSTCMYSKIVTI